MGNITMVASGKDGVGKSTACVFVGAALAALGERVLLIELDNSGRSVDVISGVFGKLIYDINDVLGGRVLAEKAIVPSPLDERLYVLSAPFGASSLAVDDFLRLTTRLSGDYGWVLLDTAATPGAVAAAAACAMGAVIVATADPLGVRDAGSLRERLEGYGIRDIRLLIGRLVPERIYAGILPDLDFMIDSVGARLIGVVPETLDIALASAGIASLPQKSFSAAVFRNIAERMMGNDVPLLIK